MKLFERTVIALPSAHQTGTAFAYRTSVLGIYYQWDTHGGSVWGCTWGRKTGKARAIILRVMARWADWIFVFNARQRIRLERDLERVSAREDKAHDLLESCRKSLWQNDVQKARKEGSRL